MKRLSLFLFALSWAVSNAHSVLILEMEPNFWPHLSTTYIGELDEDSVYNKNAPGAFIDDGIFVAIPDVSGKFHGYTYYALGFMRTGGATEGPAHLPTKPSNYLGAKPPIQGFYTTNWKKENRGDYFKASGIPELPDGYTLPKGSLFFFWISGKGSYKLPLGMIAPVKKSTLTVRAKTIPSTEEALWFDESGISTANYTIIENIQKPISAPPTTVKPITAATPTITPIVTPQPVATPCFKCRPKPPKSKGNPRR